MNIVKFVAFGLVLSFSVNAFSDSPEDLISKGIEETMAGNNTGASSLFNKAAYIYWQNGNNDKAIEAFNKSLKINQNIGNVNALQAIYTSLGMLYSDKSNYELALENFNKSLQITRQMGKKQEAATNLINIGLTYQSMEKYKESNMNLEVAVEFAKEVNNIKLLKSCYSMMSENYSKIGNTEKSYEYYNLYSSLEKHLKQKEIEEIQSLKTEVEKEKKSQQVLLAVAADSLRSAEKKSREKEMQIDILMKDKQLKDLALKEEKARLRSAKILIGSVGFFLIVMLFLTIFILKNLKQKKRNNELLRKQNGEIIEQRNIIERKNKSIQGSINYAKRIQKAMLPSKERLNEYSDDAFILLKPKDKVSGDFYFFSSLNPSDLFKQRIEGTKTDNKGKDFIISAIDCTGHGVPGAFMSTIGNNLLTEIIGMGIKEPAKILMNLNHGVKNLLKQEETRNRDGMDMALCYVNPSKKEIKFSGAKNPLIYFKEDGEMKIIKGSKFPIGGLEWKKRKREYEEHIINYNDSITCYMFSDGYPDQIGGKDGRKFMSQFFYDLLLEIHKLPMEKQSVILEEKLIDWMGEKYHQVDDILVIGFKLTSNLT
jgi:serine phosphatase RsbU (regulator of sigma subunit)